MFASRTITAPLAARQGFLIYRETRAPRSLNAVNISCRPSACVYAAFLIFSHPWKVQERSLEGVVARRRMSVQVEHRPNDMH
jgi:hypothetical protein